MAAEQEDGLIVLAVILEVGRSANPAFEPIIKEWPLITEYNSSAVIDRDFLKLKNFLPFKTKFFYRYKGSLTVSPCSETVAWIEFNKKKSISRHMVSSILCYRSVKKF